MQKIIRKAGVLLLAIVGLIIYNKSTSYAATNEVPVQSYESTDDSHYVISPEYAVDTMSFGKANIGKLKVSGDINITTTYNGFTAYGIESGALSFSYDYMGALLDENQDAYLVNDKTKKVDNISLNNNILKGALIIQKSYDGETWENAVNPLVNCLENSPNGMGNFYTTDGNDLKNGCYYRIIVAYMTEEKIGDSQVLFIKYDDKEKYRHTEVYTFFASTNSVNISVHNLDSTISETDDLGDLTIEQAMVGETLLDGSVTLSGFKLDYIGLNCTVKVNGSDAYDGKQFRNKGKYTIEIESVFGLTNTMDVFVCDFGDDYGLSKYMDNRGINGKRVFRDTDYPCYDINTTFSIREVADTNPVLKGVLTNVSTGNEIQLSGERAAQNFSLEPGLYVADMRVGNENAGTYVQYCMYFNIVDEEAQPYVNYNNLMTRDELSDMSSRHYEVIYPMTAGGYIYTCFADYDDAFAYAYDIERRYVEIKDDGAYYKSLTNPNQKVKYAVDTVKDKIALTAAVNYYARQNVVTAFFDQSEEFSYADYSTTYESEDELLECLEDLSYKESFHVFPSEEEKELLYSRTPFINNFTFIQVADYDVVSVSAYCHADSQTIEIEFDKPVDEQFTVSSVYTITETSSYGDTKVYDVVYMAQNETYSTWKYKQGNSNKSIDISNNSSEDVSADYVVLDNISNEFDSECLVKISAPLIYEHDLTCMISDIEGITLYESGNYEITFVDRVGNSYVWNINISGNSSYSESSQGITTVRKVYDSIYGSNN